MESVLDILLLGFVKSDLVVVSVAKGVRRSRAEPSIVSRERRRLGESLVTQARGTAVDVLAETTRSSFGLGESKEPHRATRDRRWREVEADPRIAAALSLHSISSCPSSVPCGISIVIDDTFYIASYK